MDCRPKRRDPESRRILWVSIVLALVIGVVASAIHTFFFDAGSFLSLLFSFDPGALLIRLLITGSLIGLGLYAARQIEKRKPLETRLEESQERFRILSEASFEGILIHEGGRILDVNRAILAMSGHELSDILGRDALELIAPEFRDRLRENMRAGRDGPYEAECLRKDGSIFTVEIRARTIPFKGKLVRVAAVRDISERKGAEAELRHSEEKYRRLVETAREGIWTIDPAGRTTFVNRRMAEMLGRSVEEMMGAHLFSFMDEEERPAAASRMEDRRHGISEDHEFRFRRKDGHDLWAFLTCCPLYDRKGNPAGSMAVVTDITEKKRSEQDKERLQAELLKAQRMETAGELAGSIAHDFNNLLTAINGYAELVLDYLGDEDPLRRDIEEIRSAGGRALELTQQLLAFSRKRLVRSRVFDVNAVVSEIEMEFQTSIGDEISLGTELDPSPCRVRADAESLEKVLLSLLNNAWEAMPQGGDLVVRTENLTLDPKECRTLPGSRPGRFVRVSVKDSGMGMENEVRERVFEPFFSTKPGKGRGLSLSAAYGIVRQHGGWIAIESRPRRGSTFGVYLPACEGEVEEAIEERVSREDLQGEGERILVVEDEKGVRSLVTRVLRENGYIVREAESVASAGRVFEHEEGAFDLVFSDVVLPDGTGVGLAADLLARKPGLRVLMSSGYPDEQSQWAVIQARGWPFLQKPYRLARLLEEIRGALHSAGLPQGGAKG